MTEPKRGRGRPIGSKNDPERKMPRWMEWVLLSLEKETGHVGKIPSKKSAAILRWCRKSDKNEQAFMAKVMAFVMETDKQKKKVEVEPIENLIDDILKRWDDQRQKAEEKAIFNPLLRVEEKL